MFPIEQAIKARFDFRGRQFCLPHYPKRGGREDLMMLFHNCLFKQGVEVGTQRGDFASLICKTIPGLHLTCVDPWAPYYAAGEEKQNAIYAEAIKNLAGLNATIIRKPSLDAVVSFTDKSLDFVYIDGDHLFDAVVQDLIQWAPKVKPGGVVALHDYHPHQCKGVMMAVDAYTHCHHIDPWYVTRERLPSAFWVVQK
jgi:predicted O-methyltransferase YrrM